MSHDLATGNDLHPPTASQIEFTTDEIDNGNRLESIRMKQRVRLSSARGMKITRLEPGSFDDVLARQPPVGYEDKTVSIEKPIETTSEFLRALSCSSREPFNNPEDCWTFSLSKHIFASHIPASGHPNIFLSHEHRTAMRESIGILASLNIPKKSGDCKARRSLAAWKFDHNKKKNSRGNAFI